MFAGVTWTAPAGFPGPKYKEPESAAAIDPAGILHVVGTCRVDGTTSTPYTVYYWSYNGGTWTGPIMISSGQGGDGNSCSAPGIAIDRNGDIHAIWSQNGMVGGAGDILYRKKQAGAWQSIQNITSNSPGTSYGSVSPAIAVDKGGNTVHVVWHDDFVNNGFQAYYTSNANLGDAAAWRPHAQWYQLSTGDYGKAPNVVLDGDVDLADFGLFQGCFNGPNRPLKC